MGCCVSQVDSKNKGSQKASKPALDETGIIRANVYKELSIKVDLPEQLNDIKLEETDMTRLQNLKEYQLIFEQKILQEFKSQIELEEYFLDSLICQNQLITIDILKLNIDQVNENYLLGVQTIPNAAIKNTLKIQDISKINLKSLKPKGENLYLNMKTRSKTFKLNTQQWNPILIMISTNQILALKLLLYTRTQNFLHLQTLFQKPYQDDLQMNIVWTVQKRVK